MADARERLLDLGVAPAERLAADVVEDAAGVDDEVGRVEDAALAEPARVRGLDQLVVRGPGDDPAAQAGNRVRGERGARGARGVDVALGRQSLGGIDGAGAERGGERLGPRRVDVGDEQVGALT